jgi:nucleoside-diphosphate-sugar epimerase
MTILVTGANGFIGVNLVRHLTVAHPDAEIVAVDVETLDVRDREACFALFQRVQPTHFVHAAAVTLAEDTSDQWMRDVNLAGTANVLAAATTVRRGVILSSSGVYGAPDGLACDEGHELNPVGAYACAKRDAEMLLADGCFPVVAARVGPVYGPFERSSVTRPRTSPIRQLLDALLEGRAVRIAGGDMHRDWTHAADIAAALDGLLFAPKLNHRIYNVSAGESISARAIIEIFVERGLQVCWESDPRQADIVLKESDSRGPLVIERLRQDTGFQPRVDVRSGIQALYD